ncbi:recombinase family protein [Caulobacter sp. 1776]|uniref:recombinase family protein n=1 Tax=Caulobacter sp. 1776 TaxID=3156420 RepID=UPI0033941165
MNLVGYYRVPPVRGVFFSPVQEERLLLMGCQEVFSDRCLPAGVVRPGLDRALAALEDGGTLAVLSLHALAGTMVDLLDVVSRLETRGLALVVAQPEIDTRADPAFFAACQVLADFNAERPLIRAAEAALIAKGGPQGVKAAQASPPHSSAHPSESGDPS